MESGLCEVLVSFNKGKTVVIISLIVRFRLLAKSFYTNYLKSNRVLLILIKAV